MGTWPSRLLSEMPADEFSELCEIARTEFVGLERTDFQFALLAKMQSASKTADLLDFMPYENP